MGCIWVFLVGSYHHLPRGFQNCSGIAVKTTLYQLLIRSSLQVQLLSFKYDVVLAEKSNIDEIKVLYTLNRFTATF
jgi:hypothetical protein